MAVRPKSPAPRSVSLYVIPRPAIRICGTCRRSSSHMWRQSCTIFAMTQVSKAGHGPPRSGRRHDASWIKAEPSEAARPPPAAMSPLAQLVDARPAVPRSSRRGGLRGRLARSSLIAAAPLSEASGGRFSFVPLCPQNTRDGLHARAAARDPSGRGIEPSRHGKRSKGRYSASM